MENNENFLERAGITFHRKLSFKLIILGLLTLVLLIPKIMVTSLIDERKITAETAKAEVMDKWSNSQVVSGPFLLIPYKKHLVDSDKKETVVEETMVILPKKFEIRGELFPKTLNRNIYDVVVYDSELKLNGQFILPDFKKFELDSQNILWEKAQVNLCIQDLRGIGEEAVLGWNGSRIAFSPGLSNPASFSNNGISALVPLKEGAGFPATFSVNLKLKGSQSLLMTPVGENTYAELKSTWNDPKFTGNFLPLERTITPAGFTASWNVLHFNRSYPQQWILQNESKIEMTEIKNSGFGVELVTMADNYQKNMRSAKYGILIIMISFIIFFFFEITTKKRIHPFQYVMAGCGIVIFYLLLLSISEHTGFNKAYIISTIAVVTLIFFYSRTFIASIRSSVGFSLALITCYGFVFLLLQMESFALLTGSIGLFLILALIMFMTRNVNWYKE